MDFQEKNFKNIIDSDVIDLPLLKKLCYTGIPLKYRLHIYKLLLGVVNLNSLKVLSTENMLYDKYYGYYQISNFFIEDCSSFTTDLSFNKNNYKNYLEIKANGFEKNTTELNRNAFINDFRNILEIKDAYFNILQQLDYQIHIDISRINIKYRIYSDVDLSHIFTSVLKLTAIKRPYIGYIQGMADLVVPFLYLCVTDIKEYIDSKTSKKESKEISKYSNLIQSSLDSFFLSSPNLPLQSQELFSFVLKNTTHVIVPIVYFCFSNLLNKIQHNIHDLQERLVKKLENVLMLINKDIIVTFNAVGLKLSMISIRWFGCLFIREFSINVWFRIFDAMLCDDIEDFLVFFGAALLLWFKQDILQNDFCGIMTLMQSIIDANLTLENVETLIGTTNYIKNEFYTKLSIVN